MLGAHNLRVEHTWEASSFLQKVQAAAHTHLRLQSSRGLFLIKHSKEFVTE